MRKKEKEFEIPEIELPNIDFEIPEIELPNIDFEIPEIDNEEIRKIKKELNLQF